MRVLVGALTLLFLARAALAEPEERVHATLGYPLPEVELLLYEEPACITHQVFWDGLFTAADALVWAYEGGDASQAPALDDRALHAARLLVDEGAARFADGASRAPGWVPFDPLGPAVWAVQQPGQEPSCAILLHEVRTGLSGPQGP
jgi:hypothetical protein